MAKHCLMPVQSFSLTFKNIRINEFLSKFSLKHRIYLRDLLKKGVAAVCPTYLKQDSRFYRSKMAADSNTSLATRDRPRYSRRNLDLRNVFGLSKQPSDVSSKCIYLNEATAPRNL